MRWTLPGIEIVRERVSLEHVRAVAEGLFGELVKVVVDIDRGIMAIAGELHADEEAVLLDDGSNQTSLWGINLFPAEHGQPGWIEFDSMINVRPRQGNRTRLVDDPETRQRIRAIVDRLVAA